MALNIIKQTGTANTTYSPGRKIEWLFIHYSASTSSKKGAASGMCSWSANPNAGGSADFAVDDETMYQYNPDIKNRYCWAVGGSKYSQMSTSLGGKYYGIANNNNSISIELSSNKTNKNSLNVTDNDWYLTEATINNSVKLAAYLMHQYNIDIDHVIMHHMRTGKWCPQPWTKNEAALSGWYDFLKRLQKEYDGTEYMANKEDVVKSTSLEQEQLYRVRKSWADSKSQLFAGTLEGAKRVVDQNSGYAVFDESGKQVYPVAKEEPKPAAMKPTTTTTGSEDNKKILASLPKYSGLPTSKEDYLNKVAEIAVKLYPHTKILPSVVIAMACLENGFGVASDAIQLTSRNNLIGQKSDLLNSTWKEYTVWGGVSFNKRTPEDYGNGIVHINDDFRVFNTYAESILDFEMFLTWAKSGNQYKYRRCVGVTDPYKVISIIRAGIGTEDEPNGYFTDKNYRTKIMNLINQYNLTKYDIQAGVSVAEKSLTAPTTTIGYYRVAKSYSNGKYVGQIGAFTSKENGIKAQKSAGSGYYVFDPNGKKIYPEQTTTTTTKPTTQTSSSNITSTSSIPEKAVTIGRQIAVDNSHGYNNGASGRGGNPDYACSSFVGDCYIRAGVNFGVAAKDIYTKDMKKLFTSHGFEDVTSKVNLHTGSGLKLGDILLKPGSHTEIYSGNGKVIGARGDAQSGKPQGGKAGDQTGAEIAESAYYNLPWTVVLRYKDTTPTKSVTYRVRVGKFSIYDNANGLKITIKNKLNLDCFLEKNGAETWVYCGSYSSKSNALERVTLLKKYGFAAEIDEV